MACAVFCRGKLQLTAHTGTMATAIGPTVTAIGTTVTAIGTTVTAIGPTAMELPVELPAAISGEESSDSETPTREGSQWRMK